ncbi:MAG: heavy metal translocating P-type ATPase [Bacteroidetes bacterium]|nr:heavy metal translocating P-type ATPase [Bacteroidota bacterium]HMU15032.1 heavy metal translocating P-type ATPase [Flavobacteriales bacterium]
MPLEKTTILLPVENMDSEHCALIVDKAVGAVPGVQEHHVELNNRQAVFSSTTPVETVQHAVQAIRDHGYEVPTLKRTFPVTGMTCASCVASVESMLKAQPGVLSAAVNLATNTVQVQYVPGVIDERRMQTAIQSIGYDLLLADGQQATDDLEAIQRKRMAQLKRKLIASVALSIPLVVIGMFLMHEPWANMAMWLLSTPVVLVFGQQFFVGAWKQAKHRSANMDTLVALSTGVAYLFSVFNMAWPTFWTSRGLEPHVYFEAAGVIITFILLGKFLEERAKAGTSSAIKKLMGLRPNTVLREAADGSTREVPIADVNVDDILVVRPGESIAVDGEVVGGESYVDESMLSGEPVPVAKATGAALLAGTINQKGSLRMRARKVGAATLLAQIVRTVQEAQGSKAPVQQLVDKVAAVFVPVVMGIALLSAVAWWIFGGEHAFTQGLLALVTVLVIACPCALGLATPTAIMAGMGKGAENGILIKDAESLERARQITAVVLDKTGTITEGKPEVQEAIGLDDTEAAAALYAIESRSEHPLAEAVVRHLRPHPQPLSQGEGSNASHPRPLSQGEGSVAAFESLTGKGATATINGTTWRVGNRRLMEESGIAISGTWREHEQRWQEHAHTVIWLADGTTIRAAVAIADRIKPTAAAAIARLKAAGIKVYMQTGDARRTAQAVAQAVGIDDFRSEVLPKDKGAFVTGLQQQGHVVAMVGDGINDSEALAKADVGIAMGHGSDIAMDVARMTLIGTDLNAIPRAITLSRKTVRLIRQNLFWAFIYNIIGIPIAAGVLYPFNGFLLDPMIAGAAMALSSVSVVSNSLRLRWVKLGV